MRLDYTLYGLAIIFFIVSAVSLVVVTEGTGKILLTVSSAIIGLAVAFTGFLCKPKVQSGVISSTPTIAQELPVEQTTAVQETVEAVAEEAPTVEAVTEVDTPAVDTSVEPVVDTEVVSVKPSPVEDSTSVAASIESEVVAEPTIEEAEPKIQSEAPSPIPEDSNVAVPVETASNAELTDVKGIGAKRADQLKALGINTVTDLANADAKDLAAKLKVSPKIVEKCIAGAKELVK
jgi:predicted flap endonuclease-1-like 5' DNA nuclease